MDASPQLHFQVKLTTAQLTPSGNAFAANLPRVALDS